MGFEPMTVGRKPTIFVRPRLWERTVSSGFEPKSSDRQSDMIPDYTMRPMELEGFEPSVNDLQNRYLPWLDHNPITVGGFEPPYFSL